MSETVLSVRGLRTTFRTPAGVFPAVDGVDLELRSGETLCVVGESGCGKSVTALSILRLLPEPPARIESGEIVFGGQNVLELDDEALRRLRGRRIAMIFQEPMTSAVNPLHTIGEQVGEVVRLHPQGPVDRAAAARLAGDGSCSDHGRYRQIRVNRRLGHLSVRILRRASVSAR